MRYLLLLFVCFCSATRSVFAVGEAVPVDPEWVDCKISVHYLWYSKSNFQPSANFKGSVDPTISLPETETFYFQQGTGEWGEVKVRPSRSSRSISYLGPQALRLYQRMPLEGEELAEVPVAGIIQLPNTVDSTLLLYQKSGSNRNFYPLDQSAAKIPSGTIGITNFSSKVVAFRDRAGGEQVMLASGDSKRIDFSDAERGQQVELLGAFQKEGNEWEMFYSQRFSLSQKSRAILLIRDDLGEKPKVKLIPLGR